jgi:phospholipid/cholesterol/gamma-HCH transport system substrate-binding protein
VRLTERNPLVIGLVAIVVIVVGTFAALTIKADTFVKGYSISANFRDTAGLRSGDRVTMAGVLIGHVGGIAQQGDSVHVNLKINHGIQLARGSTAAIEVETLLGRKAVALTPPPDATWTDLMRAGDHVPGLGGSPTEVLDVQSDAQNALATLDANILNKFLADLATVTTGKRDQVNSIIDGLNRLTSTVNARKGEVGSLIDAATAVSATVEAHNANLLSAIDNLDSVVANLDARRAQLTQLLSTTQAAAGQLATLVSDNRTTLSTVLAQLQTALAVVDKHQIDLAQTVSYLAGAVQGFSSVGYSGPQDTPNTWANIFTVAVGPASNDPLFGCNGELSAILSVVVGPDPVTSCTAYTGPVAGGAAAAGAAPAATPSTRDSLESLLIPLLSGSR